MKEYFYFDLKKYENGTVIDTVENGVWKYGMEYLRIYDKAVTCCFKEANGPRGYVYIVEPIATIYDSESPDYHLTTALKIKNIHTNITWL